jgi:hypothetical protein
MGRRPKDDRYRRLAVTDFDERMALVPATLIYGVGDVRVEDVPDGYRAMADRKAIKVMVKP